MLLISLSCQCLYDATNSCICCTSLKLHGSQSNVLMKKLALYFVYLYCPMLSNG